MGNWGITNSLTTWPMGIFLYWHTFTVPPYSVLYSVFCNALRPGLKATCSNPNLKVFKEWQGMARNRKELLQWATTRPARFSPDWKKDSSTSLECPLLIAATESNRRPDDFTCHWRQLQYNIRWPVCHMYMFGCVYGCVCIPYRVHKPQCLHTCHGFRTKVQYNAYAFPIRRGILNHGRQQYHISSKKHSVL